MELTHSFTVPAPIGETWAHFNDIEGVAGCFPGAAVTSVEGDDFKGTCKVKLGPIALTYSGSGTFLEKDEEAHRFVIEAKGKDKRGNGTAGATVTATMAGNGDSATDVTVLTDLSITGKPAQFGRGVMQDVSDKLLQQFVECLESRLAGSAETGAAEEAPAPEAAAAGGAGGAAVAGEAAGGAEAGGGTAGGEAGGGEAAGGEAGGEAGGGEAAGGEAGGEAAAPSAPEEAAVSGAAPPEPTPMAEEAGAAARAGAVGATAGPGGPAGAAAAGAAAGGSTYQRPTEEPDNALDLGATVLPVIAKAYWKQGLGGLLVLLVLWRLLRRRHH